MLRIAKQQRATTVAQQLRNLIRVKRRVQGNRRAPGRDNAKIGGDPTRVVVGHDRNPRASRESALTQPPANTFRHAPQFSIGVALYPITPLNFEGDVVRPALSTFAE